MARKVRGTRALAQELTKRALIADLEEDITIGLNLVVRKVIQSVEAKSAVWTGFYKSSWRASPNLIVHDDDIWAYNPWSAIKATTLTSKGWTRPVPKYLRRHEIPHFSIDQTVYIANTVDYTETAFSKSPELINYGVSGIRKDIDSIFTDRSIAKFKVRANVPRKSRNPYR